MGESFMTGAEYRVSSQKEQLLQTALENLIGQKWRVTLKNDEITVLVEAEIEISAVVRHENRIETGHLTLDDVYYELQSETNFRLFFPLVQFQSLEKYPRSLNFWFDSYWWMFRHYSET